MVSKLETTDAIKERSPEMWKVMQSDMRIVHHTLVKPFDSKVKCPNGVCDQAMVYDLKRQEAWLEKAKSEWGGPLAPELTWWEEPFNLMMGNCVPLTCSSLDYTMISGF